MQDSKQSMELRFRAASKVADLVYPKAASVEIDVDNKQLSLEEIDSRLISLLQKNYVQRVEKVIPSVAEDVLIEDKDDVDDTSIEEENVMPVHNEDVTDSMTPQDTTSLDSLLSVNSSSSFLAPEVQADNSLKVLPSLDSISDVEWEPSPDVESFHT